MAQGTPNFTDCIPASLWLLEHRQVSERGNEGKRTCDLLSGPQATISRLWDFDEVETPAGALGANARTGPDAAVALAPAVSHKRADDLTEADIDNLNAVLGHEIAENTMKNYRVQWRSFTVWAFGKGIRALPRRPCTGGCLPG